MEEPEANEPPITVLLLVGLLDAHHTEVERLALLVVVVVPRLALVVLVDTHTDLRMHEEEDRVHTVDTDYSHQLLPVVVKESHRRPLVHPNIEKEEEGMNSYLDLLCV